MSRPLTIAISLLAFWLLLSGMFEPFLIGAGVGSAIAVTLLVRRMRRIDATPVAAHINLLRLLAYALWLIREIIVAAWDVSKRILHPRLPISPTLVEFVPTQTTEVGLVIHANSITLTPGTISVEVEPDHFLVHALSREGGAALAGSEMDSRCTSLETP